MWILQHFAEQLFYIAHLFRYIYHPFTIYAENNIKYRNFGLFYFRFSHIWVDYAELLVKNVSKDSSKKVDWHNKSFKINNKDNVNDFLLMFLWLIFWVRVLIGNYKHPFICLVKIPTSGWVSQQVYFRTLLKHLWCTFSKLSTIFAKMFRPKCFTVP